ncbi:MAG: outer membrane lipoprotein-sorting protein [Acidobacteria bacterium]|nr:outer membrane lipoprotein-sorting protein [Acidobacteriota bacterium]|tara:strand:+ start:481 stop:1248 length:768 start_codon:yes stop_codon:yes gene_type:complete
MRRREIVRALVVALASGALTVTPVVAQPDPVEIMERVDRLLRGDSSRGVATMEVVTENWEREITMEMWSLGTEFSLVRVQAPAREAGTATLMAEDNIWNYLPKVERTIKIPSSMMGGSWMGSHFTNDDLVRESQLIEDYDIEIAFAGDRDGDDVWEFRLTPKSEAAVIWGHLEFRVQQLDYMPLWSRFYNEDGELVRTMEYSEFTEFAGRLVPAVMDMQPHDKPGERTTIRYEELEFDLDIDESFFSLQRLQRRR